jgi:ribosomal protein L7/L12
MLDPDIQALVAMNDLIAATSLYQQRHGGSVLVARKAIDAARWALTQSPGATPQPVAATLVIDPEIDASLRGGRKIEAIKRYRELTGVGLKEAKDAVEALESGRSATLPPKSSILRQVNDSEIEQQIRSGHLIDAIKLYREKTGVGLKEAKDAVEAWRDRIRAS